MNELIYETLIEFGEKQALDFEAVSSLECQKLNSFTGSRFDKVKEATLSKANMINSSITKALNEFKRFNQFVAYFVAETADLTDLISEHASILSIISTCKQINNEIYETILKYKELAKRIDQEITDLTRIIDLVILKADFNDTLSITNFLLDKDYKTAYEMVESENLDYRISNQLKEKIYFSSSDNENIEMLEFIKNRFYVLLVRIQNNTNELYAIMNRIKNVKMKFIDNTKDLKLEVKQKLESIKDFVGTSKYMDVKGLVEILKNYNPGEASLYSEEDNAYWQAKQWIYCTKNYIYQQFLGEKDE